MQKSLKLERNVVWMRESEFSIYRVCETCDVEYYVANKVWRWLGNSVSTITKKEDFDKVVKTVESIKKLNNGRISGIRVDGYFNGRGRLFMEKEITDALLINSDQLWRLRKALGLSRKPIFNHEYAMIEVGVDVIKRLYKRVTRTNVQRLEALMKSLEVKTIYELEEKLEKEK